MLVVVSKPPKFSCKHSTGSWGNLHSKLAFVEGICLAGDTVS